MQDVGNILQNQVLMVAVIACFAAQGLKLVIELIRHGEVNIKFLFTSGGMPSAHSALVGALATGAGMQRGFDSIEFAIASLFAVIVMYDAAGVRQAAGKQARILNQIIDELYQGKDFNEERLKELIGHTPFQVLVGLVLGILVSFFTETAF
jgi:hypothetical protein